MGCPNVSSLSWQNFVPMGAGVPLERGRWRGVPPKKDVILLLLARITWKRLQIDTYMLLIITSTGDRLFGFINIDDLERPWTPQKRFLVNFSHFWMQRTFQHWIATNWLEIDQANLRTKFSALNVDFNSPSPDALGSRRPAQAGVKDTYPPPKKVDILAQFSRVAWTRLQIGTDMLLIITSTGDRLLRFINIDDLEPSKRGF